MQTLFQSIRFVFVRNEVILSQTIFRTISIFCKEYAKPFNLLSYVFGYRIIFLRSLRAIENDSCGGCKKQVLIMHLFFIYFTFCRTILLFMKNTRQKVATIASNSDSLVKSEVCNQTSFSVLLMKRPIVDDKHCLTKF